MSEAGQRITPAATGVVARAAAATAARSGWLDRAEKLLAKLRHRPFDPWRLRPSPRTRRAVRRSGLFNATFYGAAPDLAGSPVDLLDHYLRLGFAEARRPNLLFDSAFYLHENQDVLLSGVNPLQHYAQHGEREGRRPHPLFDPLWYVAAYPDVDVRRGALRHFLDHGRAEGRSPSPEFTPSLYLQANTDLPFACDAALEHYLDHGRAEGRLTAPPPQPPALPEPAPPAAGVRLAHGVDPDGQARYRLESGPAAYCYAPPPRPADLQARITALAGRPRFSIVTPVYNVAPALLEACVGSVTQQWWPEWELILVDDCSPKAQTRAYLREISHPQVRVEFSPRNEGISGATNRALAQATGDYIVFLDNDDELTPDCLFELAERIAATDADYVYSDEDKLDPTGAYVDPFFKPDWSPDAFMSTMYTCHVSCVRRSLVAAVGALRSEFDGAQDYDFILRVTEQARQIEHVPKVLYHWRILPTSTAGAIEAKPYAVSAAKRCKEDALQRRGLKGEMEYMERVPGQFRVNYRSGRDSLTSIIIPTKNNAALLQRCIKSVRVITGSNNYEIIVVDNGSTSIQAIGLLRKLESEERTRVLVLDEPFNFSRLINLGAQRAAGDTLLLLNDDTEVLQTDWLDRMLGFAHLPHVGAVGAKLLYPNGTIQHCGVMNSSNGPRHAFLNGHPDNADYFGRHLLEYNWLATTAACLMVDKEKFERIGGFDEELPIAYNDVDFCLRLLKAGYYNLVCQAVRLIHHESVSRGIDAVDPQKSSRLMLDKRRLYQRHPQMVDRDPFTSENLYPDHDFFSTATI